MFEKSPTFGETIAALAFLLAVTVMSAVIVASFVLPANSTQATTMATSAMGALTLLVGAGSGYFLRAKLASPGQDGLTINAGDQGTVNLPNAGKAAESQVVPADDTLLPAERGA